MTPEMKLKQEALINNFLQGIEKVLPNHAEVLRQDREYLVLKKEAMEFDLKNIKAVCEVQLSRDLPYEVEEAFKKVLGIVRKSV